MPENKDARACQDSESNLPFFARFLEGQNREGVGIHTLKFPSDWDEGDQTMKYPSDSDEGDDSHNFAG
jgi:hypothetical protein